MNKSNILNSNLKESIRMDDELEYLYFVICNTQLALRNRKVVYKSSKKDLKVYIKDVYLPKMKAINERIKHIKLKGEQN